MADQTSVQLDFSVDEVKQMGSALVQQLAKLEAGNKETEQIIARQLGQLQTVAGMAEELRKEQQLRKAAEEKSKRAEEILRDVQSKLEDVQRELQGVKPKLEHAERSCEAAEAKVAELEQKMSPQSSAPLANQQVPPEQAVKLATTHGAFEVDQDMLKIEHERVKSGLDKQVVKLTTSIFALEKAIHDIDRKCFKRGRQLKDLEFQARADAFDARMAAKDSEHLMFIKEHELALANLQVQHLEDRVNAQRRSLALGAANHGCLRVEREARLRDRAFVRLAFALMDIDPPEWINRDWANGVGLPDLTPLQQ